MAKKKAGAHGGGGHGWFVTFADLMGLLVAFFVMLVAFSNTDQKKLQIVAGSMREAFGTQTAVRYSGIIEIDGPQYHLDAIEDARRTRVWTLAGYDVRRISSTDVYRHPERLVALTG